MTEIAQELRQDEPETAIAPAEQRAAARPRALDRLVPGALPRLRLIGLYSLVQRRTEHRVLAQQTERMAVPYVAVIHATPIEADSALVLPGNIKSYVESPIYARTNGYLKKWYKDIGSHVQQGRSARGNRHARSGCSSSRRPAPIWPRRKPTSTWPGSPRSATRTCSRATPSRSRKWTTTTATTPPSRPWCSPPRPTSSASRTWNPSSASTLRFPGVITQRNVDIGTLINAGNGGNSTKEMFDLAQTDPLRVYVSVPQTYVPSIRVGLKACLELSEFPGRKFCGQVVRTADAVDPNTRTLLTEVDVPNPSGTLLQGEYAQVHFDAQLTGSASRCPSTPCSSVPKAPWRPSSARITALRSRS